MSAAVWFFGVAVATCAAVVTAHAVAGGRRASSPELHWTERARLRWTARSAVWGVAMTAVVLAVLAVLAVGADFLPWDEANRVVFSVAAVIVGLVVAARLTRRPQGAGRPGPVSTLGGLVTRLTVHSVLLPIVVVAAVAPIDWGWRVALAVACGALAWVWLARGGITSLLLVLRVARRADPALRERVARVTERVGREPGRVVVVTTHFANVAVLPLPGDVLVYTPALRVLGDDELDAVLAHEAGHLAESRQTAWLRIVPGFAALPLGALPAIHDVGGLGAVLGAFVFMFSVAIVARRRSARLESAADVHAHAADPQAFARALVALYEANSTPAVLRGRRSHPDLYDRLLAAGVEPDFPRPEPPSRGRARLARLAGASVLIVVMTVAVAATLVVRMSGDRPTPPHALRRPR